VLPFAKRGDDRGNNLVRLQQMFPRIVAADFQQPLHVSPDCQHLLARMLTPDPGKRISVAEIMRHPWRAPRLAGAACKGAPAAPAREYCPGCGRAVWGSLNAA
jgi:serine/threonine protein kinase